MALMRSGPGSSSRKQLRWLVYSVGAGTALIYIVWHLASGPFSMSSFHVGGAEQRGLATVQNPGTVVDRHAPWGPSKERDAKHPELAALLRKVAINDEVLVAVSNQHLAHKGGMLDLWMRNVKRAGVKNAMVFALDTATQQVAEEAGIASIFMKIKLGKAQEGNGSNHAVSSMKFRILRMFLELGYSVFLSDVDIITLKNPFGYLTRDSDVEALSDGWDKPTAYGYNDVFDDEEMGWARYAHSMRVFVFNSGLFYIRPTIASMDLINKVIHRVEDEGGWDQALFNECIFFPSHPGYKDPSVTRRVLDIHQFMNSKVLFKFFRYSNEFKTFTPVMVHVNYHSNKFERLLAIEKRYVEQDMHALDNFEVKS